MNNHYNGTLCTSNRTVWLLGRTNCLHSQVLRFMTAGITKQLQGMHQRFGKGGILEHRKVFVFENIDICSQKHSRQFSHD